MIKPECHLLGESFSPGLLRSIPGILLSDTNEPGDIGKRGRFKQKPIRYGACSVCVPESVSEGRIKWLADFIFSHKGEFEKAGATMMTFWIYWYGIQGNMEFTVEELVKIAATQIPLAMTYIFVDEEK